MTTEAENKELVYRLNDVWQGDLDVIDEVVADDYENHNPIVPDSPPGPDGFKQNVAALRDAFPDIDWTIEDVIADADRVAFRAVGRGTHEGPLLGIEATGRETTLEGIVIFRITDGQVAERWAQFDTFGMLRQLGAIDPDELADA